MCWLWALVTVAHGIDLNDHIRLTLDGGEIVEGYFLRPGRDELVLTRPGQTGTTGISLQIISTVQLNGADVSIDEFHGRVRAEWAEWVAWAADPPAHPHPGLVGVYGGLLAGSGHAAMGQWNSAISMMTIDAAAMGLAALQVSDRGPGRVDVLVGSLAVSMFFKAYAISDGSRRARRIRQRLSAIEAAETK